VKQRKGHEYHSLANRKTMFNFGRISKGYGRIEHVNQKHHDCQCHCNTAAGFHNLKGSVESN
jgi:hypothetical protein